MKARSYLDERAVPYTDLVIDSKDPLRIEMLKTLGRSSVPAIWLGGSFVGGMNDGPEGSPKGLKAVPDERLQEFAAQ